MQLLSLSLSLSRSFSRGNILLRGEAIFICTTRRAQVLRTLLSINGRRKLDTRPMTRPRTVYVVRTKRK